jgi:EAL domain-containing protein (putative c-di-GMP-specific phosphodiesterase class I)
VLTQPGDAPGRVLLVDDEESVRKVSASALRRAGFETDTATGVDEAAELLRRNRYNAVVSDLAMPGSTGLDLLRLVRASDLDVPVILMTGFPEVQTAVDAVEFGAFRYLIKPVTPEALAGTVRTATRLHRLAVLKREALSHLGETQRLVGDRAGLQACFGRALDTLTMAYQPIVSWSRRALYAYEALMRPAEPTLPNPGALLAAAEQLGRLPDLGRAVRARALAPLGAAPADAQLFLNLNPQDLLDEALFEVGPLSAAAPRVVLELTERASLHDVRDVAARVARLRALGFRIAIDDLGAGYAGLTTLALLEPEVVKIDMGLVRDIDRSPTQRALVRGIVWSCRAIGSEVIAEGIETVAERDVLVELGVDLLQGYLFARPGPPFPAPRFET